MDMRIFLRTLLETSGYRPVLARNGSEGLCRCREEDPALVILDVMMPGQGGVKMYLTLKTDDTLKSIPVIMLSAVAERSFEHYLRMLNVRVPGRMPEPCAYVEKPPEPQKLLQVISDCLAGSERLSEK